jgi:CMP/dCMP kinase
MEDYSLNPCNTIAIDGPAATGKSSVGLKLANRLGFFFLDTGLMYRAVTWAALTRGFDINDESKISKLAANLEIIIKQPSKNDGRVNDIVVDGVDVSRKIIEQEVNDKVSQLSKYKGVRKSLTVQQQKIANNSKIVMVGRDIGTVVLPNADIKIFLKASLTERTKRRYKEELCRGGNPNYKEIFDNIEKRDLIDSTRAIAPLVPAKDAIIINTDNKSIDQVVDEILSKIDQ